MFFIDVSIWAKMRHINVCVCFNCRGSLGTKWNVNGHRNNVHDYGAAGSLGTKWNVNGRNRTKGQKNESFFRN